MDPKTLIEHHEWMRSLAWDLLRDEDLAEDIAQQAIVVGLESDAVHPKATRSWLRKLVRNLSHNHWRSTQRRLRREQRAAASERVEGASHELVELRSVIVEAVLALREPYGSTIYGYYFEGLDVRGLAGRMEVSTGTVRSRLSRGQQFLRESLDTNPAFDRNWRQAILPLVGASGAAATLAEQAPLVSQVGARPVATSTSRVGLSLALALTSLAAVALLLGFFDSSVPIAAQGVNDSEPPVAIDESRIIDDDEPSGEAGSPVDRVSPLSGNTQRVASRIRDAASGQPLEEVAVTVRSISALLVESFVAQAATQRDGAFELVFDVPVEATVLSFALTHPDFAPVVVEAPASNVPDLGDLWLEMNRGTVVRGRVESHDLKPISGGSIYLRPNPRPIPSADGQPILTADSRVPWGEVRSDGTFEVRVQTNSRFALEFRVPGYQPEVTAAIDAPIDRELRIRVGPGHTYDGRVVDSAGMPIEGAQLLATGVTGATHPFRETRVRWSAEADVDGRFRIDDAPVGLLIAAVHREYSKAFVVHGRPGDVGDLVLLRLPRIAGRVIDLAGRPIAHRGGTLHLGTVRQPVTTDGAGRFLTGCLDKRVNEGTIVFAGSGSAFVEWGPAADDRGVNAVIELGDVPLAVGRSITVRVRDDAGDPLAGAAVVVRDDASLEVLATSYTDRGGEALVLMNAVIPCRVEIGRFDRTKWKKVIEPLETDTIDATLLDCPMVVGSVASLSGDPLPRVVVSIEPSDRSADVVSRAPMATDDGAFELGFNDLDRVVSLVVSVAGGGRRELVLPQLSPGQRLDLGELRVAESVAVDLRIVGPDSEPRGDVALRVEQIDELDRVVAIDLCSTDRSGVLSLRHLLPSRYRASLAQPGDLRMRPFEFDLRETKAVPVFELSLKRGREHEGRVSDRLGRPIPAVVEFHTSGRSETVIAQTDNGGRFFFDGLPIEGGVLEVRPRESAWSPWFATVERTSDLPSRVELESAVRLTVELSPPEDGALEEVLPRSAQVEVVVLAEGGARVRERFDAAPELTVRGLPAGGAEVVIFADGCVPLHRRLSLTHEADNRVRCSLVPWSARPVSVRGAQAPIPGAHVRTYLSIAGELVFWREAWTDRTGIAPVLGWEEPDAVFEISAPGYRSQRLESSQRTSSLRSVRLEPGARHFAR